MTTEQTFEHPPAGHVAILVYDPTNARFNVVQGDDVDTAIPAAGKALLAAGLAHGYDGTAWRKLNLLWGYYDRWAEVVVNTNADPGNNLLVTAVVPEGYVYVLNAAVMYDVNNVSSHYLYAVAPTTGVMLAQAAGVAAAVSTITGYINVTLAAGDYVQALFQGCTGGDDLYLHVWGYKMRINQ